VVSVVVLEVEEVPLAWDVVWDAAAVVVTSVEVCEVAHHVVDVVVAAISVVAEVCVAVWIEDVAVVWTVE
jgi:hypothetical protein